MVLYRQRILSPADLISACDHLAVCAKCRAGVSDAVQLQSAFDALGPSLHQTAAMESAHLTDEDLAAYSAQQLVGTDLDLVSDHLEICAECNADAARLGHIEAAPDRYPTGRKQTPLQTPLWATLVTHFREQPIRTVGVGLAVIVLVALCISTFILYAQVQRFQAEVRLLQRQESELRSQLRALESLPAQLAELRQTQLSPQQSEFVVALNDAGKVIGLDKDGSLVGLRGLSPAQEALIKTALTSGRLTAPGWLAAIRGGDSALMGTGERESFRLSTPVGITTRSNRPAFRWTPLTGATTYKITVSDSNFNKVLVSEPISGTEWTPSRPLERGVTYIWEVTAIKDGKGITAPAPPAPEARFRVLDSTSLIELEAASRENGGSHLFLGLLYARAGLLADAERELQSLTIANPESPVARKLLNSVKSLQSPKNTRPN
jgi:hypothetical protein